MRKDERMTVADVSDDDVLTAGTRRREIGSGSARSLLLTVLGEFVHPRGTPVWTSTLVAGLAALGIEEKSARQAIARSATDGVLEPEKSGRRVCWHLTASGTQLLADGTRRIYGFLTDPQPWDGEWLVLSVAIPETQRQLRHKLRTRLTWLGMGTPSSGIWILPNSARVDEVAAVIEELELAGRAFAWTGRLTSIGKSDKLIADAWSLDDVEALYANFLGTFGRARAQKPVDAFTAQVRLVQAWRRFPFLDPALPAELLDHAWPGPNAARLFRRRHDEWHSPAQAYWSELQSSTSA
jgi:phenylacetic acid degradation operon negative regulatory protein